MPIQPKKLSASAEPTSAETPVKNNLASLDAVLSGAETARQRTVNELAERLAELGDPEQIIKDAIAKAQELIQDQPTETLDATIIALENYDPFRVLTGDIQSFIYPSDTPNQPLLNSARLDVGGLTKDNNL